MPLTRRSFLLWSAALGASAALPGAANAERTRLGIVGLGERGLGILESCRSLEDRAEVVALCDRENTVLKKARTTLPEVPPLLSTNPQELFASATVDAVVLALPMASQLPLARTACLAGKNVLLLRPLPFEAPPLLELAALAANQRRRVEICREMVATLEPAGAVSLLGGDAGIETVSIESRFQLQRATTLPDLLARLVDELDFGLSLLEGPITRRFELGGPSARPGAFIDYQLHLECHGKRGPRSLTLHVEARPGKTSDKAGRILLGGNHGSAAVHMQKSGPGALEDLSLFLQTRSNDARGKNPKNYANIVELLTQPV